MTTAEETTSPPQTTPMKRCFSGSGRYANRKWAPGGDATYLSRLRKAHLADEQLPDPWYIQEHGGVEAENQPEEGWPTMSAMDIATRLDQERGPSAESHWVHTLEQAAEKAQTKAKAKEERAATARKTKEERDAERKRQASRPKKNEKIVRVGGERDGQEATVLRTISPTQLLLSYEDGFEELVTDEDIQRQEQPADEGTEGEPAAAEDESEFVEQ